MTMNYQLNNHILTDAEKRAIRCYQKAGFVIDGEACKMETLSGKSVFYRMSRK